MQITFFLHVYFNSYEDTDTSQTCKVHVLTIAGPVLEKSRKDSSVK